MQAADPPTFHPTVWPAEPPGAPPVRRYRLKPVPGVPGLEVNQVLGTFELPPDFVLRELLEQIPRSTADVERLTAEWGLASGVGERTFEYFAGPPPVGVEEEIREWLKTPRMVPLLHPEAVRAHLAALRAMSRHLLAYLEGLGEDTILLAWQEIAAPQSIGDAWWLWERYINGGLTPFAVHVRASAVAPERRLTRPVPNLYNACCLQLAQYLTRELSVNRCGNERCRKPFTKQRGLAKYGQHRARGVRYCTPQCAKAQSERGRRRRRAHEERAGQ